MIAMMMGMCMLACSAGSGGSAGAQGVCLATQAARIELGCETGVSIQSLTDVKTGHNYIIREQPLFSWAICEDIEIGGWNWTLEGTSMDMAVTETEKTGDSALRVTLYHEEAALRVYAEISMREQAALIGLRIENCGDQSRYVSIQVPCLSYLSIPGENPMAMVAQEAGWTARYSAENRLGMLPEAQSRLPSGANAMEVAAVYNPDGAGGVFMCTLNGSMQEEQLNTHVYIDGFALRGAWAGEIEAGETHSLPVMAVGLLGDDDWHGAVDYFLSHGNGMPELADTPEWFAKAGGIFSFPAGGAGGINQMLPFPETLQISSFTQMDTVLAEAQAYGTDLILMVHYYQKAAFSQEELESIPDAGPKSHYWNKGDYIIRKDLGGEEAFREGIRKVHEGGGRVLVYVEPYIILQYSEIGRTLGEQWAARSVNGEMDQSYPYNWTMLPAFAQWRDYIVGICERLVREYDVDGIYLDSLGWQWNHVHWTMAEARLYTPEEYNRGFVLLTDAIRDGIRHIKPDAVVMSEAMGAPLMGHVDGAWTADYTGWAKHHSAAAITDSPLRYAGGGISLFTGGTTIQQMREMFAAGWSLAVSSGWQAHQAELEALITLRREYADALIMGQQDRWASCDDGRIAVYTYEGAQNTIITACNVSNYASSATISLPQSMAGTAWKELIGGAEVVASAEGALAVGLDAGALAVFLLAE